MRFYYGDGYPPQEPLKQVLLMIGVFMGFALYVVVSISVIFGCRWLVKHRFGCRWLVKRCFGQNRNSTVVGEPYLRSIPLSPRNKHKKRQLLKAFMKKCVPCLWSNCARTEETSSEESIPLTINGNGPDNCQLAPLQYFSYDEDPHFELGFETVGNIKLQLEQDSKKIKWIVINGNYDKQIIDDLGEYFKIHSLIQTDIITAKQRTKLHLLNEDGALFLICQVMHGDPEPDELFIDNISFYLKENLLITFEEKRTTLFDKVKKRIREEK
ncbi:unnamed protein product, partial [Adineta steineri]